MPGADAARGTRREIVAKATSSPRCESSSSTFDLDEYVFEALRVGASGFLRVKEPSRSELIQAVRAVAVVMRCFPQA